MNRWYKIALKQAKKSERPKYKMGAIIVKSGRVIASSPNGKRTGRHAEIRAISKDVDLTGATIYIARHGGEGLSRPCRACFALIQSSGIKKMVFKEDGDVVSKVVQEEDIDNYRDYCIESTARCRGNNEQQH